MNPEIFENTLNEITEKLGEEQAAIIADSLGTLKTAQKEALDKEVEYQQKIEKLQQTNEQLIASNGNLLRQVPTREENMEVPRLSNNQPEDIKPVDPFDKYGRLKR